MINTDLRDTARIRLEKATRLLEKGDDDSLRYACLELRSAIEALAYDALRVHQTAVPPPAYRQSTPKAALRELLHCDPCVETDVTFTVHVPASDGVIARDLHLSAHRMTGRWANKAHNALDNFLHQTALRHTFEGETSSFETARSRAHEIAAEINAILSSTLTCRNASGLVKFECSCNHLIVRDVENLRSGTDVVCSNCGRYYNYSFDPERKRYTFNIRIAAWECLLCSAANTVPFHDLEAGKDAVCKSCGEGHLVERPFRMRLKAFMPA